MTVFVFALSFAAPILVAYAFLTALGLTFGPGCASKGLKISMAIGLGIGFSSFLVFPLMVLFNLSQKQVMILEGGLLILALLFSCGFPESRKVALSKDLSIRMPTSRPQERVLGVLFLVLLVLTIVSFWLYWIRHPHGAWDAWSFWNLRAKFLALGPEGLTRYQELARVFCIDQPLLTTGFVARCWSHLSSCSQMVPMALALSFSIGTVILTSSVLALLRSPTLGFLNGIVLLGAPALLHVGGSQMADGPLAFYYAATGCALCLAPSFPSAEKRLAFLAGLFAGLAASTKNQGLLFTTVLLICLLICSLLVSSRHQFYKIPAVFFIGAMPGLLVRAALALMTYPDSDDSYWPIFTLSWDEGLFNLRRPLLMLSFILKGLAGIGGWGALALFILILVKGLAINYPERFFLISLFSALSITLTGYCAVIYLTPHDLAWIIESSAVRLLYHLWPSAVFLSLICLGRDSSDEEAATDKESPQPPGIQGQPES